MPKLNLDDPLAHLQLLLPFPGQPRTFAQLLQRYANEAETRLRWWLPVPDLQPEDLAWSHEEDVMEAA